MQVSKSNQVEFVGELGIPGTHPGSDIRGQDAVLVGLILLVEQLPADHGDDARLLAAPLDLLGCLHCQAQLRACT